MSFVDTVAGGYIAFNLRVVRYGVLNLVAIRHPFPIRMVIRALLQLNGCERKAVRLPCWTLLQAVASCCFMLKIGEQRFSWGFKLWELLFRGFGVT